MAGRTALVTGASSGIGAAFAERLAEHGAHLVLVARSVDRLEACAAHLHNRHGVRVLPLAIDLARPGATRELAASVDAAGPPVEMVVNNAGLVASGPVAAADTVQTSEMIAVNISALTEVTMHFLPGMLDRGRGTILNVASTVAYQPAPYLAVYSATKAYVLSFTQALWAENRDSGVRILALCPGPTDTPMNAGPGRGRRSTGRVVDTAVKALSRDTSSVIDGAANSAFARGFSKRFPDRTVLALAERLLRPAP